MRSGLSRGLLGYEGSSCRPHRHLAPVRRAHRAPDRAFRGGGGLPRRTVRSTQGVHASHGCLRCPGRGLRGRGWRPRAVRLPRAYPACTSRSQSGMAVLGFGERPPGALVRSVQGCSECLRACAACPARDPRVRGRHPRPSCSSRPLAACTSGTRPPLSFCCRGSASRAARSRTSRHKHSVTPNLTSSPLKMVKNESELDRLRNAK